LPILRARLPMSLRQFWRADAPWENTTYTITTHQRFHGFGVRIGREALIPDSFYGGLEVRNHLSLPCSGLVKAFHGPAIRVRVRTGTVTRRREK
jgi:hypothetical protein